MCMCELEIGECENSIYFSVKEAYKDFLSNVPNHSNPLWFKALHKVIPLKVCCLVWRLFTNRLSTNNNLFKRNSIWRGSLSYVGECWGEESVSHFFRVPFFLQVFGKLFAIGLG